MRQVYGSREPRSAFLHCTPCLSGTSELPTSPSPHQCGGEGWQAGMTEGRNQGGSKPGLPFCFKPSKPHPGVRQGPGSPQGARSRVLGGVSKSTAPWSHLGLLTCKTQRSHGRGPDRAAPPVGTHLSPPPALAGSSLLRPSSSTQQTAGRLWGSAHLPPWAGSLHFASVCPGPQRKVGEGDPVAGGSASLGGSFAQAPTATCACTRVRSWPSTLPPQEALANSPSLCWEAALTCTPGKSQNPPWCLCPPRAGGPQAGQRQALPLTPSDVRLLPSASLPTACLSILLSGCCRSSAAARRYRRPVSEPNAVLLFRVVLKRSKELRSWHP